MFKKCFEKKNSWNATTFHFFIVDSLFFFFFFIIFLLMSSCFFFLVRPLKIFLSFCFTFYWLDFCCLALRGLSCQQSTVGVGVVRHLFLFGMFWTTSFVGCPSKVPICCNATTWKLFWIPQKKRKKSFSFCLFLCASFVRSITMDSWSDTELSKVKHNLKIAIFKIFDLFRWWVAAIPILSILWKSKRLWSEMQLTSFRF